MVWAGFDSMNPAKSRMRHIQGFFASAELPIRMVSSVISSVVPTIGKLVLVMDRTNGGSARSILMMRVKRNRQRSTGRHMPAMAFFGVNFVITTTNN
jgi:hypothetical protein